MFWSNYSDLTRPHPKWWFSKGIPLISGKSRLVKYYNLARVFFCNEKNTFFVGGQSFFGGEGVSRGYTTLGYWVLEGLLKRQIWESLLNQQFFGEMGYVIFFFVWVAPLPVWQVSLILFPLQSCRHVDMTPVSGLLSQCQGLSSWQAPGRYSDARQISRGRN